MPCLGMNTGHPTKSARLAITNDRLVITLSASGRPATATQCSDPAVHLEGVDMLSQPAHKRAYNYVTRESSIRIRSSVRPLPRMRIHDGSVVSTDGAANRG
jgi:hypothetical protein